MKYQVVTGNRASELTEKVNELIASGWKPQGGVATSEGYLWQALVKPEGETFVGDAMRSSVKT